MTDKETNKGHGRLYANCYFALVTTFAPQDCASKKILGILSSTVYRKTISAAPTAFLFAAR